MKTLKKNESKICGLQSMNNAFNEIHINIYYFLREHISTKKERKLKWKAAITGLRKK